MKTTILALILFVLPPSAGAGWEYYVLNEQGEWQQVSPRELDLSAPGAGGSTGTEQRVMIRYDRRVDRQTSKTENWIPQIESDLVDMVEGR